MGHFTFHRLSNKHITESPEITFPSNDVSIFLGAEVARGGGGGVPPNPTRGFAPFVLNFSLFASVLKKT